MASMRKKIKSIKKGSEISSLWMSTLKEVSFARMINWGRGYQKMNVRDKVARTKGKNIWIKRRISKGALDG